MTELSTQRAVLNKAREGLLGRANVLATGIGYKVTQQQITDKLSLVCSVSHKFPAAKLSRRDLIPSEFEGVPTDVVETGPIRALQGRTGRHRPAPGGVSIGHRAITAGTLGCLVKKDGRIHILSNNHVLANSNNARAGDAILQPGPIDGGLLSNDTIAELTEFVPIEFEGETSDCPTANGIIALLNIGCRLIRSGTRYHVVRVQQQDNLVDAAIARPLNESDVNPEILEIGSLNGVAEGELGLAVKKSGRTTGLSTGEIEQVDVTVNVQYGDRVARFTDQLLAGPMSQGGDSGSAVLDHDDRLVGLLFAGSDNTTIINRIGNVFAALDLEL